MSHHFELQALYIESCWLFYWPYFNLGPPHHNPVDSQKVLISDIRTDWMSPCTVTQIYFQWHLAAKCANLKGASLLTYGNQKWRAWTTNEICLNSINSNHPLRAGRCCLIPSVSHNLCLGPARIIRFRNYLRIIGQVSLVRRAMIKARHHHQQSVRSE